MPRYVVIEFPDNKEADWFIEQVNQDCAKRRKEGNPFLSRIVGVFVKPGRTCNCPDWGRANYGDKNWQPANIARGEKFGWWVCSRCSKPRKGGHQLVNQLDTSSTYEGAIFDDYETCVTSLEVSGFHTNRVKRDKKLKPKKVK